jgi:hypothetical protein
MAGMLYSTKSVTNKVGNADCRVSNRYVELAVPVRQKQNDDALNISAYSCFIRRHQLFPAVTSVCNVPEPLPNTNNTHDTQN